MKIKVYDYSEYNKNCNEYTGEKRPENDDSLPLLIECDDIHLPEIYNILVINNKAYTVGSTKVQNDSLTIYVTSINPNYQEHFTQEKEPLHHCESEITCPYCGYQETDSWECEDQDDEYYCGQCGSIYSYERHVSVEYTSEAVKKANITVLKKKKKGEEK